MIFNGNIRNNEMFRKNQGVILIKLLISHLIIALEYQTWYQKRLRHSNLTIWVVIKETKFESSLILKKALEIKEKSIKIKC